MGFLSGPITFECYRLDGKQPRQFGPQHIEILERFAIGRVEMASMDQAEVGFLAGAHVLDCDFGLEKNIIGDALHFAVRIDTNQVPAAVRKAWLQIELATAAADNPSGRPTKAQRQEAKDAVEARCEEEVRSGKFRRMQQLPLLWDARRSLLYVGGTSATANDLCCELFARAFEIEPTRLSSGRRAMEWAAKAKRRKDLDETAPADFRAEEGPVVVDWWNGETDNYDFLGHEFLLWLWWRWETESDTIELPDGSEVTGMFVRTLSLQCPRGESGKDTITSDSPVRLPEAALAIRSGKFPRRAGLTLVRHGQQCDLVLQADGFTVSGAKIQVDKSNGDDDERGALETRLESVNSLNETLDLLLQTFCERRIGKNWPAELGKMRRWLKADAPSRKKPAA